MPDPAKFMIVNIGTLSKNKFWGETEPVRSASATCTLLEIDGRRLLIDPSPHPPELKTRLFDRAGLRPAEIDQVVLTHFHGDHRFGLALFPDQPWLMPAAGLDEWRQRSPDDAPLIERCQPAEAHLPPAITLLHTPGHTWQHYSLQVDTIWGRLIIAADAAMTEEFFLAEEGYHNSVDFALAAESVRKVKAIADLVIPGHGNFFLNR